MLNRKHSIKVIAITLLALTLLRGISYPYSYASDINRHPLFILTGLNSDADITVKTMDNTREDNSEVTIFSFTVKNREGFYLSASMDDKSLASAVHYITARVNDIEINLGEPLDGVIRSNHLYLSTNNSFIILIDADVSSKNFLKPIAAYRILVEEKPVKINALSLDPDADILYMSFTYRTGYTGIMALALKELTYGIPTIQCICWVKAAETGAQVLEVSDVSVNPLNQELGIAGSLYIKEIYPFFAGVNIKDLEVKWAYTLVNSYMERPDFPVSIHYNRDIRYYVLSASSIYEGNNNMTGFIGLYSPGELSPEGYLYAYAGSNLSIVDAVYADKGLVYAVGSVYLDENNHDLVLLEVNPGDGEILNSWTLIGGLEEELNRSSLVDIREYIWFGATTESYRDENNFSGLIAMLSPSLEKGDIYRWETDPPKNSKPEEPIIGALKVTRYQAKIGKSLIKLEKADGTIHEASSIDYREDKLMFHVALNYKPPEPVPEPWYLGFIIAVNTSALILVIMRLRRPC